MDGPQPVCVENARVKAPQYTSSPEERARYRRELEVENDDLRKENARLITKVEHLEIALCAAHVLIGELSGRASREMH